MRTLVFAVEGLPQPQGSSTAFMHNGTPVITSDNPKLKPWRKTVVQAAWDACAGHGWPTAQGPVEVSVVFLLPKGKTVRREYPTTRPDIDKLCRAILDALTTAGVFRDDSQVIGLFATKVYAAPEQPIGVEVAIENLEEL